MAKHDKPPVFAVEEDEVIVISNAKDFDPQKAGESLTATALKHGGKLKADDAVEEARDPRHPLHRHLEWDDAKAGHQFRVQQMRSIIRIVRIETGNPVQLRRAFISAPAPDGRAYRSLADVLKSSDLQDRIMEQADKDLAAWQHRYAELKDLCEIVETARVALRRRRQGHRGKDDRPSA
jgi:hypothetical protein